MNALEKEFDELDVLLTRAEIQESINDEEWQRFRVTLHGLPTHIKKQCCAAWLHSKGHSRKSVIQVMNYKNALKRGGLV